MRYKKLWGATLWGISLVVALSSCKKEATYDLYEYEATTLQLKSFGISSEGNTALKDYPFAINNLEGEGLVSNAHPLPYATELKNIKFSISPVSATSVVTLDTGSGTFDKWVDTLKYTLPADVREIRVRVGLKDSDKAYIYRVRINQYTEDPNKITWVSEGSTNAVLTDPTAQGFTAPLHANDRRLLIQTTGNGSSAYSIAHSDLTDLRRLPLSGLESGERIVMVRHTGSLIYALTDRNVLYKVVVAQDDSSVSCTHIETTTPILGLIGILPTVRTNEAERIAVVVNNSQGLRVFATLAGGKLTLSPKSADAFPYASTSSTTYSEVARYKGAELTYVHYEGYYTLEDIGGRHTTTNGLDWITTTYRTPSGGSAHGSITEVWGRHYGVYTNKIVISRDRGATWTSGQISAPYEGITPTTFEGRSIVAWTATDNTICVLSGVGSSGQATTQLWRGTPVHNE